MAVLKSQEQVYLLKELHSIFYVPLLILPQALTHITASPPVSAGILFWWENLGHFQVHTAVLGECGINANVIGGWHMINKACSSCFGSRNVAFLFQFLLEEETV